MNPQMSEKPSNFLNKQPKSALSLLLDENSNSSNKKRGNTSSVEFRDSFFGSFESVESFSSIPAVEISPKRKKSGLLNVYELISLILEDASENNESPSLSKSQKSPSKYIVMPAEEDGTPMDDLPSCSSQTDLLNFGVTDFVIINKVSAEPFAHVRIEANKLVQDRKQERQNTLDSEESYYILPEPDRSSSVTNPDAVPLFRTDTDESQHRKSLAGAKTLDPQIDALPSNERPRRPSSTKSPRHRSSSGSLVISYRCNNSERWRIAKPPAIAPPVTTADSTDRRVKSFTISNSKKRLDVAAPVAAQLDLGLPRRHSERPYMEELDGGEDLYVPLNPHTSSCRMAQFSPTSRSMKAQFSPSTPISPVVHGKFTPKSPSAPTTPQRPPKLLVSDNLSPSNQSGGKPRQQQTSPNRSSVFAKLMDLFQSSAAQK